MYVCMYVLMYVCLCVCMHVRMCACVHACKHACVSACMRETYTRECVHTCLCDRIVCLCECVHSCAFMCVCSQHILQTRVSANVQSRLRSHVHVCNWSYRHTCVLCSLHSRVACVHVCMQTRMCVHRRACLMHSKLYVCQHVHALGCPGKFITEESNEH